MYHVMFPDGLWDDTAFHQPDEGAREFIKEGVGWKNLAGIQLTVPIGREPV